jgi:hypothetical protein
MMNDLTMTIQFNARRPSESDEDPIAHLNVRVDVLNLTIHHHDLLRIQRIPWIRLVIRNVLDLRRVVIVHMHRRRHGEGHRHPLRINLMTLIYLLILISLIAMLCLIALFCLILSCLFASLTLLIIWLSSLALLLRLLILVLVLDDDEKSNLNFLHLAFIEHLLILFLLLVCC